MFQKAIVAASEALTVDQRKASFWGFRRRVPAAAPAPAAELVEDSTFAADVVSAGFEAFGRSGLELGGLHRDQQWVGAWGGRC
jgi:hypothetical protein